MWSQLEITKAHVAYTCIGVFSSIFSLVSLFVKEQLYIGESMVASIFGLIVGPYCLNWFNPLSWGNTDSITLEISRILLCLQVFAVSVELPRKYMLKHWVSVTMLLVPVMTSGWLVIGLFIWILIPGLDFSGSLLMGACITATDPVLAQSVVSGTFAQKVPGHLRNLLSCESGCNDGLAFPFIFLSLNLLLYPNRGNQIVKNWVCITILWECVFGSMLGCIIGYCGRKAIRIAEGKRIIDRESFLAFYLILALTCAGFGSMLGVDDLLVSFFAGTTFAWDGWFAAKTHESNVSNVIDVLLNYAYFVYLGSILPWKDFNNSDIGLDVWRLIILSLVVIFLRRIPVVLLLKPLIPDIKSWREAMFIGHFGPIGVGAVFAAITSKSQLESHLTREETPLKDISSKGSKSFQAMACVWPITCFSIMTSVIVHGSSVAIIMLGRYFGKITLRAPIAGFSMKAPMKNTCLQEVSSSSVFGYPFSLKHFDEETSTALGQKDARTSGLVATPSLGIRRRWRQEFRENSEIKPDIEMNNFGQSGYLRGRDECADTADIQDTSLETLRNGNNRIGWLLRLNKKSMLNRAEALNMVHRLDKLVANRKNQGVNSANIDGEYDIHLPCDKAYACGLDTGSVNFIDEQRIKSLRDHELEAHIAYTEDDQVIIENGQGEILELLKLHQTSKEDCETKYYAYSVGDDLMIAEENGALFRKYRIDLHGGKRKTKKLSGPEFTTSTHSELRYKEVTLGDESISVYSEGNLADDEAESLSDTQYNDLEGSAKYVSDCAFKKDK